MQTTLLISLLQALAELVVQHLFSFVSVYMILFFYTIPLGYAISRVFGFFETMHLSLFETYLLSFSIGLSLLVPISYFSLLFSFTIPIITTIEVFGICGCLLLLKRKVPTNISDNMQKQKMKTPTLNVFFYFLIFLLFLYYSIVPLTTDYADFRDYPLLTLGIEETSRLVLPLYNIETYYPPGSSLVTGVIHLLLPEVNPTVIMLQLSHFFVFIIALLFYLLGYTYFQKRSYGIFFMVGYLISATSRNFVTGGSTIPANLATISGLLFFLFILAYYPHLFRTQSLPLKETYNGGSVKYIIFSGIFLGVSALSHFDTLLTFLWGFLALTIIGSFFAIGSKKPFLIRKIILLFTVVGIISFAVASPFLLRSFLNKESLDAYWTEDKWLEHAQGELHPKSLHEIMYFVGPLFFLLAIAGIALFLLHTLYHWMKGRLSLDSLFPDIYFFSSISLWILFLLLSNSFFFLKLTKPLFLFYALNIILWHGITIPLTFALGFLFIAFHRLHGLISANEYFFYILLFFLLASATLDYETVNKQNAYTRQGGFLLLPFADRAGFVNSGDIEIFALLSHLEKGLVVAPNNLAGQMTYIYTGQPVYTYFTHHFYDNFEQHLWMFERVEKANDFFRTGNKDFLIENNISYIFLPAEIAFDGNYTSALLSNYTIIAQAGGAKLFSVNPPNVTIYHIELENISGAQNGSMHINDYSYGSILSLKTVELHKGDTLTYYPQFPETFAQRLQQNPNATIRISIKHLAFLQPLSFAVTIHNKKYNIERVTPKLTFVESYIDIPAQDILDNPITFTGMQDGLNFLYIKHYYPELDWIEFSLPK